MTIGPNDSTLNPVGEAARQLTPFDDGRVLVRLAEPGAWTSRTWRRTTDERTGLTVEVRRASCGGGCWCAGEVRVAS